MLGQGVPFVDKRDQPRRLDMRVNLRGGDIRVAEQRLQRAQVRPALQQVRGEGDTASAARPPIGTSLSFPPLPVMVRNGASRGTAASGRATSSLARRPEP